MFDVRPVDETGDLDWEKINSVEKNVFPAKEKFKQKGKQFRNNNARAGVLGYGIESDKVPLFYDSQFSFINSQDIVQRKPWQSQKRESFIKTERERMRNEKIRQLEEKLLAEKLLLEKEQEQREKIARERLEQQKAYEAFVLEEKQRIRQEKIRQEMIAREKIKQERLEWEKAEREKELWLAEELAQEKNKLKDKKEEIRIVDTEKYFSWKDLFSAPNFSFQFNTRKYFVSFAIIVLGVYLGLGGISYASKSFSAKGEVLGATQDGFSNLTLAVRSMADRNFANSEEQFSLALANFSKASEQLDEMGGLLLDVTKYIPFASKISSGRNAVEAGKHFSEAGKTINEIAKTMAGFQNPMDSSKQQGISFLEIFRSVESNIAKAEEELNAAQENVDRISVDDLPEDKQDEFILLKQGLPEIRKMLDSFLNNSHIFVDLLGGNGPRKYLFLFQNNSEMRPTGGFIGSYGLLDISNGHVKKFFIDGIFNPDGQLKEKIVPPQPVQKISAAWSLHDSNWFADFPLSAKKAIYFYEKTGGPTVDGVITFTPTVMQKLLEITGPIDMPDYGVTLNADNFVETTQYEVEVDYDKEENQPKKILSDLAPMILEKLLSNKNLENASKVANVFLQALSEKHMLLYFQNQDLQSIISKQGWSGEIIPVEKDYLSVINTNINGYKTDAVIEEKIDHKAEIQSDGSVIDTVTITRKHTGGNSKYEWFNKVNADYMRVYVPKGSKLLEANGQTRETNEPPLDYDALKFKRDEDVQREENNMIIDPQSGTRIYDEKDKTVFANWTYVSPQETMTITYKYLLPFKLFKILVGEQQADSYSLLAQKQSGSLGSSFNLEITYPLNYEIEWLSKENLEEEENILKKETTLSRDYFAGVVFKKQ